MSEDPSVGQSASGNYIAQADRSGTASVNVISYGDISPRPVEPALLEAARRLLSEMPLDQVPEPTTLPPGSVIRSLSRNPLFVSREAELTELARKLKPDAATDVGPVVIAVATGLGGIGKTQLAIEFVHRYGRYFEGGVFWLSFADPNAIPAEVAACGGAGRMRLRPDFHALPFADQVSEVMSAWQSAMPRLLVFDNCEDPELLAQWRPPTGGCRVLVTSRRERWDRTLGVEALRLDVLRRVASVALLREHRTDLPEEDPDLDAIAQELGDLPLALDLAGRFLAKYRSVVTPAQYLEELRRSYPLEHRSLQEGGLSPTGHEQNVARTFALSYERLDTADPTDRLAVALLARAARFAPGEPIFRPLLIATLSLPEEDPEAALLAEDALSRLTALGLLQREDADTLRMHRLVAAFVRDVADDEEAQVAVEASLAAWSEVLLEEVYPALLVAWLPHLRHVTAAAKEREDVRAAHLCAQLGLCLFQIGLYDEARVYLERALYIWERTLGMEHPDTAKALNNLGILLFEQGRYAEARSFYERALIIWKKIQGEEHLNTARVLNNLGRAWAFQQRYAEARPFYERALAIFEKTLGEEHPDTVRILDNLGNLLRNQGDYEGALHLHQRALAIFEKTRGEEHPDTVIALTNLGNLLVKQGSYDEARRLREHVLAISEKTLGEEHPGTGRALDNLGIVLWNQGALDEARPLCERALAIFEKTLGEEHPDTVMALTNLTGVLLEQGAHDEARRRREHLLDIRERVRGNEHPSIAQGFNIVADILREQGMYDEARLWYEHAQAMSERVFGRGHPFATMVWEKLRSLGK